MHLRAMKKTRNEVFLEEPISRDGEGNEVTLVDLSQRHPLVEAHRLPAGDRWHARAYRMSWPPAPRADAPRPCGRAAGRAGRLRRGWMHARTRVGAAPTDERAGRGGAGRAPLPAAAPYRV